MTTYIFANNAISTLNGGITSTATQLSVQSADQALFPVPGPGQVFMVTLEDRSQSPFVREIMQCTGIAGNILTVVRGQEGTTPVAFNDGVTVSARITAGILASFVTDSQDLVPRYIGAYSSAPSANPDGTSLVIGTLYFNTTNQDLYEWSSGSQWIVVSPNSGASQGGLYLGAFATAPTTMNDGSPLVVGSLYWNTTTLILYEYSSAGWGITVDVHNIIGDVTITGNLTASGNIVAQLAIAAPEAVIADDLSVGGTLYLDGLPVVTAEQLNGTANLQHFPNGTFWQWGTAPFGSPVTFPTPYTTEVDVVMLTAIAPPNQGTTEVTGVTTAGFTPNFILAGGGGATTNCYWFASGK